jgi:hypothetical protein
MSDYRPNHEALARRRAEGFVAMCSCGWIGRERSDRRSASRDAREHEERAPVRELRRLAKAEPEGAADPSSRAH